MKSTGRKFKSIFSILLVTFAAVMLLCVPAYAAKGKKDKKPEKAVKATMEIDKNVSASKRSFIISGISASGKTVWTYTTSKQVQTELASASMLVNGKFVYVIDANKYIRLRLADGKVTLKKKLPTNMYSATMAVDKKGSLYAIGYYGATLYKISSRGDIIWKHVFSADYYWPSKITLSGRKVVVAFDGDPKFAKAKVDARTGK